MAWRDLIVKLVQYCTSISAKTEVRYRDDGSRAQRIFLLNACYCIGNRFLLVALANDGATV